MVTIKNNIIYPQELRDLAGVVLKILDEQNILSLKDLKHHLGQRFSIKEFPEDIIEILERPSNYKTKAFVLAYNREGTGVIINTVSNEVLKYSKIIIKRQVGVKGYIPFASDRFGNIIMNKYIMSKEFSMIRKELQNLTEPENYLQLSAI